MHAFYKIILFFFAIISSSALYSQNHYWQQQVNFTIDVQLNDIENSLNGFETITYTNNSPDTLHFLWFHIWPNAYKNDKTAFSEQLLKNNRTDFYFSSKDQRGYINRLSFKVDGLTAETEDHPQYIDIEKVLLPTPLVPGKSTVITTPFHVQLPFNFSRGGHIGHAYQVTQWFPKPAVYDIKGWHEMPYLDQGEFYSEFGNYDVSITVPSNYVVAATGDLQNDDELNWLKKKATQIPPIKKPKADNQKFKITPKNKKPVTSNKQLITNRNKQTKTLRYLQNNVHDFAWFTDKDFIVNTDTLKLPSGKIINTWSFYLTNQAANWKNSLHFIKEAVLKHSAWLGEYPYNNITAVQANTKFQGGMEYPTITLISETKNEQSLDQVIFHELGHNWLQGILASNERTYGWMDEGFNTYYDHRYKDEKYIEPEKKENNFFAKRMPVSVEDFALKSIEKIKQDQPINISSEQFTELNYGLITYYKTGEWMKLLQEKLGKQMFDSCMHEYYRQWQFKHSQPEDFKKVVEQTSNQNLDAFFEKLERKGSLDSLPVRKKITPAFIFNLRDTDKKQYISIAPAIGYNDYDHFMVGAFIHNYQLPLPKLQFFVSPLYATNSKTFTGLSRVGYNWYKPSASIRKIELAVSGAKFSMKDGMDSSGNKIFSGFYKIAPSLRVEFDNRSPLSAMRKWIEWKTYLIGENNFNYAINSIDSNYYPAKTSYTTRYINQLTFVAENNRTLYPYRGQLQMQQGASFWKATFTGNYFFNYAKGGGASVRLFAAKFGQSSSAAKSYTNYRYMPKLVAVNGNDDYTYSNYFIGRTEMDGLASQQIMMRDGDLKILHTDIYQSLPNRSANWVAAINLNTSIPYKILPKWIPIKLYLDLGTTAEAWNKNETIITTSRILYVGGLQLSLFKNVLNIYAPLVYSSDFKEQLKTDHVNNTFGKRISFSIDIQNITARKILGNRVPL